MSKVDAPLAGRLVNVRDLGGLQVLPTGRTRPGVLIRSEEPHPGDALPDGLTSWPPATVIDLRSPHEGLTFHPLESDGALVHRVPLIDPMRHSLERLPDSLTDLYLDVLNQSGSRLAMIVDLAAKSHAPLLVHCAFGKDRTGIAIAVLLLLAGVPEDEVVRDYVHTHQNMTAVRKRLAALPGGTAPVNHPSVPDHLMAVPAQAIEAVCEVVTANPGGPEGWVGDRGVPAAVVNAWRRTFVQP